MAARVCRAFAGIVLENALGNIGRDSRVEAAVTAAQDVDVPALHNYWGGRAPVQRQLMLAVSVCSLTTHAGKQPG